jgi:ATP adenylyltransferase
MRPPEPLPILPPAALLPALRERARTALASGALRPIETVQRRVQDGGVAFLVRAVSSLRRKAREAARGPVPRDNPFLPPEPALTVGALSDTHLAVLNKFNVLEHHLLIVTRAFEPQEALLGLADFAALGRCLGEIDGLGFYNGGREAGASQEHKHLQLVPLPLGEGGPAVPMEARFDTAEPPGTLHRLPGLPFEHAFCRLPGDLWRDDGAAGRLEAGYREMLERCGIPGRDRDGRGVQTAPYNLLLRRRWMLLVPRTGEHSRGISVNALGYAGSLFVRDPSGFATVEAAGPMGLLTEVGRPRP